MHPRAIENIREGFEKTLNDCQVNKGRLIFSSYKENFFKTSKQLLKFKKDWISLGDIFDIFNDEVKSLLLKNFSDIFSIKGKLVDLIKEEKKQELLESIMKFIDSIPRTYLICFPLGVPEIKDEMVIELNDATCIKTSGAGLLFGLSGPIMGTSTGLTSIVCRRRTYFCFKERGYFKDSINDSAFREAFSKFKQLLYWGHMKKIFVEGKLPAMDDPDPESFGFLFEPFYDMRVKALIFEKESDVDAKQIVLPDDIAKYIEKLSLNIPYTITVRDEVIDYIKRLLMDSLKVIANAQQDDDVVPIKTALEWAFDASINNNETISFIQTCIGLEAILGDGNDEESLTKKLADRCAYLLGGTVKQRNEIRKKFKDFYKLRSNLVHGREFRLDDDKRQSLYWGNKMLDRIIAGEISKYLSHISENKSKQVYPVYSQPENQS